MSREKQSQRRSKSHQKTRLSKLQKELARLQGGGRVTTAMDFPMRFGEGRDAHTNRVAWLESEIAKLNKTVNPQKTKLAIPQTPQEQFKQNYPNLDWYDPKNYSGTGADAEFKSEAELKVLDRSAMISNVGEYSNLPKDRTAQSMKIIENLNRAEPVQQSVAQDQETPSLNKTTTIQGNNEISEGLKIANRERKYNDPKYKLSRIQQKLVDSGFTRDELQKLRENHANWKVTRGKK